MLYYLCIFYGRDKLKKILQLVLAFLLVSENAFSATKRKSSKKTTSTASVSSSVTTYRTPTQSQCNVDIDYCFDRYCFDKKTLKDGVYSKCGAEPASTILINVEDCLATRAIIKKLDLQNGCKSYSYDRVVQLLANRGNMEKGLKKNSKECEKATKALAAAKACYALMVSSDGSPSLELYNQLDSLCGFKASGDSYMLNRFYQAGDYGDSNIGALEDLRLTNQNTQKRENWRQIVDATLAGYTEIAELACGEEDYKITRVNQYALDSRENLAMAELRSEAEEIGKQTANRIVNQWFRETDCVNSPLPAGGLYWDYKKGGNPDCRLVCGEGYSLGRDSSSCVKNKEEVPVFITFSPTKNEEVVSTPVASQQNTVIKRIEPVVPVGNDTTVVSTNECSKDTTEYTKWHPKSKGVESVCEVFFPNCKARYYSRNTESDEFFCTGSKAGVYDKWYNMKLSNDDGMDLNAIFGTNYKRFGNGYKEEMSLLIKETCLARCGGKDDVDEEDDDDPVVEDECKSKASTVSVKTWKNNTNTSGSSKCYPKECQTGYHICDLGKDCCLNDSTSYAVSKTLNSCIVPEIDMVDIIKALKEWETFLNRSDVDFSKVSDSKSRLLTYIEKSKNRSGYLDESKLFSLDYYRDEMNRIKGKLCPNDSAEVKTIKECPYNRVLDLYKTENYLSGNPMDCRSLKNSIDTLQSMVDNGTYNISSVKNMDTLYNILSVSNVRTKSCIDAQCEWTREYYNKYLKKEKPDYLRDMLTHMNIAYSCCIKNHPNPSLLED